MLSAFAPKLLTAFEPETAHRLTIKALSWMPRSQPAPDPEALAIDLLGLHFPNPVGLAAGFDKNAQVPDALLGLGFGFVEVGGATPEPQEGNPRPRVFRLPKDGAVINRYGLNNDGFEAIAARLSARRSKPGIVGLNLGANKDSLDRMGDYAKGVRTFAGLVDFLTINVSSPNTVGLRDLQAEEALDYLLGLASDARARAINDGQPHVPILLKIAPDMTLDALDAIILTALRRDIDGLIISNTTIARPENLQDKDVAHERGGLSGKPLFEMSTRLLANAFVRLEGRLPLIGVGGIDSAEAAWIKMRAGAHLVQLYTALVYKGPHLIKQIKEGLVERLQTSGHDSLKQIVGVDAAVWAS